MYNGVVTSVRTCGGITGELSNYRFASMISINFISICNSDGWAH